MTALLAFAASAVVLFAFAWSRTNARRHAYAELGRRLGLEPIRDGDAVRRRIDALPAMQAPGRIMISHALATEDEVLADWRVVRPPKDRPRDRQRVRTVFALRQPGAAFETRRESRDDVGPGGAGAVWIESGGEWLACHSRTARVPNDALVAFRERARLLLETPPAD